MRTFFEGLTGANCTLGGQTIISLSATEDMDADYATASAVCLAPNGKHARGSVVQSVEGGASTGYWEVEDPVELRSGERTWRRKAGEASYRHLPLASYRLRRKNYKVTRGTLSKATVGASNFPPKFCTWERWNDLNTELNQKVKDGELDFFAARREARSYHVVAGPTDIIATCCRWFGMQVYYLARLEACPPEYTPVAKTLMIVVKEVAGWSGASVYLNRLGNFVVYDWREVYNRGGSVPQPRAVMEKEEHDGLYPFTQCTVIGKGRGRYWVPPEPGRFRPPGANPDIPQYVPPRAGYWRILDTIYPVEVTSTAALASGEKHVEQRIEINDYEIHPTLAGRLAGLQVARAMLMAATVTYKGPAEGSQAVNPVDYKVFTVQRNLEWTGTAYRYFIEITGPRWNVDNGGGTSVNGWW